VEPEQWAELTVRLDDLHTLVSLLVEQTVLSADTNTTVHRIEQADLERLADGQSAALSLGYDELTRAERMIFDAVYRRHPGAAAMEEIGLVDGMDNKTIRENAFRMRPKLLKRGWIMVTVHSTLRLIERQPVPSR